MIEPNKGVSTEKLELLRQESYERMCTQLKTAIEQKLTDFQMTWDDLAERLAWEGSRWDEEADMDVPYQLTASNVRSIIGNGNFNMRDLSDVAHVFSAEVYMIFRPRFPWIAT